MDEAVAAVAAVAAVVAVAAVGVALWTAVATGKGLVALRGAVF